MNILKTFGFLSLSPALYCAQDTKQSILNAVTTIKPVQQIILDYLDIPDHLVQKFTGIQQTEWHPGPPYSGERIKVLHLIAYAEENIVFAPQHQQDDPTREPIQIRNIVSGTITCIIPHDLSCIEAIAISPNSKYLAVASASNQNQGYMFEVQTRQVIYRFNRQNKVFAFSDNSRYFASCYFIRNAAGHVDFTKVDVWDMKSGTLQTEFNCKKAGCLQGPRFSPDNKFLVYATSGYDIFMLEIATQKSKRLKSKEATRRKGGFVHFAFSPNGKFLICYFVHNTTKDQLTQIIDIEHEIVAAEYTGKLIFDPRGTHIIGQKKQNSVIEFAEVKPQTTILRLPIIPLDHIPDSNLAELQFSKDGTYLIVQYDNKIAVYQNQALDLACQPTSTTDLLKETNSTDKKTFCVIS